jgi:hypothetical protein
MAAERFVIERGPAKSVHGDDNGTRVLIRREIDCP